MTIIAIAVGLVIALAACGGDDDDDSEGRLLRVVSTVSPITSIVENIGGTRIDLTGIIPEGANSHTFEPAPSVVSKIEDADLIVLNGLQLEEPTLELAEANKNDDAVILLLGDETLSEDEYKFDFSFPISQGRPNPHLWPDPTLVMEYAQLIRDALVDLDSANEDYYSTNLATFNDRLEVLDRQMLASVQTVPPENRKLLTYHDSWAYWADRYDFTVIGAIQPSDFAEPSASEVASLIDQIDDEGIPAIFGSEVFASDVLETIANETGAEYIDDLRDDDLPGEPGDDAHSYLGLMVENMRTMIPALGGDAAPMNLVVTGLVFEDGPSTAVYPQ
ncbi:MAG: zinc ABC transporter substrate-binding protein [Chloroflexi bacterium]|nr:zinc ABC transporter substrate-binding protein [Chloroflexota bacterium]